MPISGWSRSKRNFHTGSCGLYRLSVSKRIDALPFWLQLTWSSFRFFSKAFDFGPGTSVCTQGLDGSLIVLYKHRDSRPVRTNCWISPNFISQSSHQSSDRFLSAFSAFLHFSTCEFDKKSMKTRRKTLLFSPRLHFCASQNTLRPTASVKRSNLFQLRTWPYQTHKWFPIYLIILLRRVSNASDKTCFSLGTHTKMIFDRNSACLHWCFCFQTTVWCYKRNKPT